MTVTKVGGPTQTSASMPRPNKERNISTEETALRAVFRRIKATVRALQNADKNERAKIRKRLTKAEKALVDVWFKEGRFEVARRLLGLVGRLYRTEGVSCSSSVIEIIGCTTCTLRSFVTTSSRSLARPTCSRTRRS